MHISGVEGYTEVLLCTFLVDMLRGMLIVHISGVD